jgi:hypothetical protein
VVATSRDSRPLSSLEALARACTRANGSERALKLSVAAPGTKSSLSHVACRSTEVAGAAACTATTVGSYLADT